MVYVGTTMYMYTVETEEFIQILHNGSDHWLVITTIGDHVKSQIASFLCTQDRAISLQML